MCVHCALALSFVLSFSSDCSTDSTDEGCCSRYISSNTTASFQIITTTSTQLRDTTHDIDLETRNDVLP